MGDRHPASGFVVLSVLLVQFIVRRRQRLQTASAVALLALSAPSAHAGTVILRFNESLTQCAHCILEQGQTFQAALSDGSPSVDALNASIGVTSATEIFVSRHGMTTEEADQQEEAKRVGVKQRFPKRTRRIPAGMIDSAPMTCLAAARKSGGRR